jgi:uncharacterized membrane protein
VGFASAVDVLLVFGIARISSHPLRTSGQLSRDSISWVLLGIQAVIAVANTGAQAGIEAAFINYDLSDYSLVSSLNNAEHITNAFFLLYGIISFLVALALLAVAIRSYRKCSTMQLDSRAPKFMIIVSALWLGRAFAELIMLIIISLPIYNEAYQDMLNYPAVESLSELFAQLPLIPVFIVLLVLFKKSAQGYNGNTQYIYTGQPQYGHGQPQYAQYGPGQAYQYQVVMPQGYPQVPQGYSVPPQGMQQQHPPQGMQPPQGVQQPPHAMQQQQQQQHPQSPSSPPPPPQSAETAELSSHQSTVQELPNSHHQGIDYQSAGIAVGQTTTNWEK